MLRDAKIQAVQRCDHHPSLQEEHRRAEIVISSKEDTEFVSSLIETVQEWLTNNTNSTTTTTTTTTTDGDDQVLHLPPSSFFYRTLQYQTLRKYRFDVGEGEDLQGFYVEVSEYGVDTVYFFEQCFCAQNEIKLRDVSHNVQCITSITTTSHMQKVKCALQTNNEENMNRYRSNSRRSSSKNNFMFQLKLTKATPLATQQYMDKIKQDRVDAIQEASSFVNIMESLRDSNKPAVGHNISFDVAFILQSFIGELPKGWGEYKELVQSWFPGGIYDTKWMAENIISTIPNLESSLSTLYALFHRYDDHPDGADFEDGSHELHQFFPFSRVDHSEQGLMRYCKKNGAAIVGADENIVGADVTRVSRDEAHLLFAHEAGYDSYATGYIFIRLMDICAKRNSAFSSPSLVSKPQSTIASIMSQFNGKIFIARSDLPFLALIGPDPTIDRSSCLYVSNISLEK